MAGQGINKQLVFKKQSAKGTAASGAGGQILRRRTAGFDRTRDKYDNDEITSHQMSTGSVAGISRVPGKYSGLISGGTHQVLYEQALRKLSVATADIALGATTLSIAASGGAYTFTRSAGDFMAAGAKIGDVFRLAGAGLAADTINKNLAIIGITATVITALVVNGSTITAPQATVATCTLSFPGKKVWVPDTGQTDDWLTWEEWFPDIPSSEVNIDTKIASMAVAIPSTGNATLDVEMNALSRSLGTTQNFTSPAVETTSAVVSAAFGLVVINGVAQPITGGNFTITTGYAPGEAEVGNNNVSDQIRGRIRVEGQFMAKFTSTALQAIYNAQTTTPLIFVCPVDATDGAAFVTFVIPRLKLFGDADDDGEKEIIRTYPFTAEINGAGGAALSQLKTIVSVQDSLAV